MYVMQRALLPCQLAACMLQGLPFSHLALPPPPAGDVHARVRVRGAQPRQPAAWHGGLLQQRGAGTESSHSTVRNLPSPRICMDGHHWRTTCKLRDTCRMHICTWTVMWHVSFQAGGQTCACTNCGVLRWGAAYTCMCACLLRPALACLLACLACRACSALACAWPEQVMPPLLSLLVPLLGCPHDLSRMGAVELAAQVWACGAGALYTNVDADGTKSSGQSPP